MDTNPALRAYINLNVSEEKEPKKASRSFGLLSRSSRMEPKEMPTEPKDRVREYVASIRKARKQVTNG